LESNRRRVVVASSVPVAALAALFATQPSASAATSSASAATASASVATPAVATRVATSTALLRIGSKGTAVVSLQKRLAALGYWVGAIDGVYGPDTAHAVTALQKVAGLARDGVVGPRTSAALAKGVRPKARTTRGDVIEIDLAHQVLLVVHTGHVRLIFDTSTGSGAYYYSQGSTHHAVTPKGVYHVFRAVNGWDSGPLGKLYRPRYFNGGIAVHGYPTVPSQPASHGCVRVTIHAMDYLWAHGVLPIGRSVLVR
jgi:lipoprotein-anchoring transpeptidase ErfK/SrfK